MTAPPHRCGVVMLLLVGACATPGTDLAGLADQPPLDCAVLLTGGAFLIGGGAGATFASDGAEALPIDAVRDVLLRGRVFQRLDVDPDPANRQRMSRLAASRHGDGDLAVFLADARAAGFDYLLVVEQLQDGAIERLGTNSTWPVTLATWILLGVGALIPDCTFESRATLRVSLRELQTGRAVHDPLLIAGPVDLSLVERTDLLGLLMSIVVPPFWVGDDPEAVRAAVQATTVRRLLASLARDLKSEIVRQRLRDNLPARLSLSPSPAGWRVVVQSNEALSVARLRAEHLAPAAAGQFAAELLASVQVGSGGWRYEALLPAEAAGRAVQVLVGTLRGDVASATFVPGGAR